MTIAFILWVRHLKRHVRIRSRVFGSLMQPMLYLTLLGFGFGAVFEQAGHGSYLTFLTPGVVAMSIISTAFATGGELIWDRQFGVLRSMLVAPVSRLAILIGRVLGGATVATLQGLIVLTIAVVLGFQIPSWTVLVPIVLVMLSIATLFTTFGILVALCVRDFPGFQLFMNMTITPMFFASGALFPLHGLPPALQWATRINPLTYGVDALRGLATDIAHYPLIVDIAALMVPTALCAVLGVVLFSRLQE